MKFTNFDTILKCNKNNYMNKNIFGFSNGIINEIFL